MPDIWTIRHAIYRHFAETARAPSVSDISAACSITADQALAALQALHEVHALFLDPATGDIRIANPFSGVPTDFLVDVAGRTYWANCAWDTFGVIAALQARDGLVRAACAENGAPLQLAVQEGETVSHGEVVHFLVPFSEWYADMVFT